MITNSPEARWQDIGWNGLYFKLPASWQPTVIYPAYLFFELEGRPVLEIKCQQISGRFSAEKNLDQIRGTLKNDTRLVSWDIPQDFQLHLTSYTASGFQLQRENSSNHGLLLFCSKCNRVTLLQWYIDTVDDQKTISRFLESFREHSEGTDQPWSIFDIKALLPAELQLRSHEFLPGRYTLCFDLGGTSITLYRFKPAAVLLSNQNIGKFGSSLLDRDPQEEGNGWASWAHKAEGLEFLLAKARRNPVWQWMRLWHTPEHNVILGVKAEGKYLTEAGILENICNNYSSIEPH